MAWWTKGRHKTPWGKSPERRAIQRAWKREDRRSSIVEGLDDVAPADDMPDEDHLEQALIEVYVWNPSAPTAADAHRRHSDKTRFTGGGGTAR